MQPAGEEVSTVLVWVLFDWHAPHALYVKDVQAGGVYVHAWDRTGVPVQPAGLEFTTVLVWVLFDWQEPQAE